MLQQIYPQVGHDFIFELNKDFQFAAAHYLPNEAAGKCSKVHGHTYFCNLTIGGNHLDDCGMLVNFHDLKKLVHDRYDHQLVNEVPFAVKAPDGGVMPSTEIMAAEIWYIVQSHLDTLPYKPKCLQVFLRETPTSYVLYRPSKENVSYADK